MSYCRVVVWIVVMSFVAVGPLFAQAGSEGTVRGYVKDDQGGVLPGVTINATSPTVPGIRTAISDGEGFYRLINLPPGDYNLTAELQGFAKFSRPNVTVRAGLNIAVDITMKVGGLQETVTVTADTPMLEVQQPVQSINIAGEFQRALPLGSRHDYSDFLEVTPGVTARSFDQATGGQVYMLRGSEIENHVVQIDGADVGSFRQGWAGLYVNFSEDAIKDTQVKTGGDDASAPLGVGVVINVATQSGTNRFNGAASMVYQARSWNGNNNPGGTSAVYEVEQPDVSVGGPIVKDNAWFFGAFRYVYRNTGIARTSSQLTNLQGLVTGFTPFDNSARDKYYFAKGTVQLSPKHQLMAFYQRDLNPETGDNATDAKTFAGDVTAFGGDAVAARLTSVWGQRLTTSVLAAYNNKSINNSFAVFSGYGFDGPQQQVFNSTTASSGTLAGSSLLAILTNYFNETAAPTSKTVLQADATYYRDAWAGSHEFRAGVFIEPRLHNENDVLYANNGAAVEDLVLRIPGDPTSGTVPFHRRVYSQPSVTTSSINASDYAGYVQDSWRPTARLTINGGVRFDNVRVHDNLFNVQTQNSLSVGPRFGATYVLTSDEKNVLRVNWDRIADLPQPGYLPTAGNGAAGYTDYYDTKHDGSFSTVITTPAVTTAASNQIIDPNRTQPYVNEWLAGYRRQFPGQTSLDVSFVHRAYQDRPANVETNGIYTGGVFQGFQNVAQNQIYLQTNNTWNSMVYNGLEITVAKRTKNLNILSGYTRAWSCLDGTWIPNDPASFIQPNAFPNCRGLGSIRGNEQNLTVSSTNNGNGGSLGGTADTRSPSWIPNAFRLGTSYQAPWNLLLASNFSWISGAWSGPIVTTVPYNGQFGPSTLTLSNGRVVSNPLATTYRFAYATRNDGQIEAPNLIIWNLRVGRNIKLGTRSLDANFDVFNVTNRGADQQFLTGGNQLGTANYAIAADGSFNGGSRQFARSAQISVRYQF
jgi:hypothetical protein